MFLFIVYWNEELRDAPGFHKSATMFCWNIEEHDKAMEHTLRYTRIDPKTNISMASKVLKYTYSIDTQAFELSCVVHAHPTPEFALPPESISYANSSAT